MPRLPILTPSEQETYNQPPQFTVRFFGRVGMAKAYQDRIYIIKNAT